MLKLTPLNLNNKHNCYFVYATGNGGLPYHRNLIHIPKEWDWKKTDIEEFLDHRFGPFSSGHRGWKIKQLS